MITQMKKYTFLVFHRDYEPFLEQLRDLGVVHITQKAAGLIENDENLQTALQHEDALRKLIALGAPDELISERTNIQQHIADAQTAAQQAAVWGDFDPARLQSLQEAGYPLHFYACSTSADKEEWGIAVGNEGGKTYFIQVGEPVDLSDTSAVEIPIPEKSAALWLKEADQQKALLADVNTRIETWQKENLERLQNELTEARQSIDWQRVTLSTDKLADGALCLFEGFCPIDKEAELNAMLEAAQVYYEESDPTKEDATPIKLRNYWFT